MDLEGKENFIGYIQRTANLPTKDDALEFALTLTARLISAHERGETIFLEEGGVFQDFILLYRKKVLPDCVVKREEQYERAKQKPHTK